MNKALLSQLSVFVIGFLVANLSKRSFDRTFRVLIALPIGWALFGISGTAVYALYFTAASQTVFLVALALTTLALLLTNIARGSLSRDSVLSGGAGLLLLAAVCFCVNQLSIVTMAPDSSYLARFGQNIGLGSYEGSRMVFSMWGPFVPFVHSITNLLDQKLYWQYQPVLSINFVVLVFYSLYTIIRKQKSILQSCVAATALVILMALSNIFLFNSFYIHTNMLSALYLYLFGFAVVKMTEQPGTAYELLALLSLIAFSMLRVEAPLFAIVILLVVGFWQGWSYVNRLKLIVPFVVLALAWYAWLYFVLPEAPDQISRKIVIVTMVAFVGFGLFAVLSCLKVLEPLVKRTPFITLIMLALLGIILTVMRPGHMFTSLDSIAQNLFVPREVSTGDWGLTWYVILFLATELYFVRRDTAARPSADHWMFAIVVGYLLLLYNLAYFREPYHTRPNDSSTRMVLQAMPLVLLYLSRLRFARS